MEKKIFHGVAHTYYTDLCYYRTFEMWVFHAGGNLPCRCSSVIIMFRVAWPSAGLRFHGKRRRFLLAKCRSDSEQNQFVILFHRNKTVTNLGMLPVRQEEVSRELEAGHGLFEGHPPSLEPTEAKHNAIGLVQKKR